MGWIEFEDEYEALFGAFNLDLDLDLVKGIEIWQWHWNEYVDERLTFHQYDMPYK